MGGSLYGMRLATVRVVAAVVLYGGWLLPFVLGRLARSRDPGPAGEAVAGGLAWIAGGWLVVALAYALVQALRIRRGLGGDS